MSYIFNNPYYEVRVIPMSSDPNEPEICGSPSNDVKNNFFNNTVKLSKKYYYHEKMIDLNAKPTLALFQYKNKIIAYGRVVDKVKATDKRYTPPSYNNRTGSNKVVYGGFIEIDMIFKVDISLSELNNVLNTQIRFSQVQHKLDIKVIEFQSLLFEKTQL